MNYRNSAHMPKGATFLVHILLVIIGVSTFYGCQTPLGEGSKLTTKMNDNPPYFNRQIQGIRFLKVDDTSHGKVDREQRYQVEVKWAYLADNHKSEIDLSSKIQLSINGRVRAELIDPHTSSSDPCGFDDTGGCGGKGGDLSFCTSYSCSGGEYECCGCSVIAVRPLPGLPPQPFKPGDVISAKITPTGGGVSEEFYKDDSLAVVFGKEKAK